MFQWQNAFERHFRHRHEFFWLDWTRMKLDRWERERERERERVTGILRDERVESENFHCTYLGRRIIAQLWPILWRFYDRKLLLFSRNLDYFLYGHNWYTWATTCWVCVKEKERERKIVWNAGLVLWKHTILILAKMWIKMCIYFCKNGCKGTNIWQTILVAICTVNLLLSTERSWDRIRPFYSSSRLKNNICNRN